ncbi:MAG: ABC transporter ATP-binding protein [Candidatus Omnitrophota bacterium]
MLRLENLTKRFGKVTALSDINLEISDGTFCVVLGPSGCGKSTLLNVIAGLEEPTEGRIYLGDKDITNLSPHKRDFAMVFQNYALYPHLSAFENMAFGLRIKGMKKEKIEAEVRRVSKILNIEDKLGSLPRELSGGQRQRVATGRAIAREPKIFLFDEPLSNLDARLRIELRAELIKLHKQLKKTVVYVTHDQVEAMALGEKVVLLKDGRIQQVSTPQELYYEPKNLFAAEFIGTPPMNVIELKVSRDNGKLALTKGNFKLQVPPDCQTQLEKFVGRKIYFGIRPSHVSLAEKGQLKGEVLFIETIGEDSFVRINLADAVEINAKIEAPDLKPGDRVSLNFDPSRMYFFDDRGSRIYPAYS